ncbi:MAG: hypothetical protein DMF04_09850 [Verrucomicrobia bacterium]|nr:MAG: hypothetical protein DMF04_09850 [Verrucomicrobiota bacterium]
MFQSLGKSSRISERNFPHQRSSLSISAILFAENGISSSAAYSVLFSASALFCDRMRSKRGKQLWDRWKLKLPVFGPLVHKICMSRFARTFAQLIRSGVPILEVLDIVGGSSGNHVVETSIKEVGADVEKGDNLSVSLSRKSIFPPMLLRMVAAGEATGKIDTMLEKMADFWDEEIEAMLDALTSLIEPMLIVFLGVIVGGIVIAMFLPIFKLNEVVSQTKSN